MKTKDGDGFESYVAWVQQQLLELEGEDVRISRNTRLMPAFGSDAAEFDVFYEFKKAGVRHRVAIEVKDVSRPIESAEVRDFAGKLGKVTGIIGIMISRNGYQKGCYDEAKRVGIELLKPGDIPHMGQMVAKMIEAGILPNANTKADPFYMIMFRGSQGEDRADGTYFLIERDGHKICPLFVSRPQAERLIQHQHDPNALVVCGITQRMLMLAIRFSKGLPHRPSPFELGVVLQANESGQSAVVLYDPEVAWNDFVRNAGPFPKAS